jgi:hypothetical protein
MKNFLKNVCEDPSSSESKLPRFKKKKHDTNSCEIS